MRGLEAILRTVTVRVRSSCNDGDDGENCTSEFAARGAFDQQSIRSPGRVG